jgi:hypothetical protein
MLSELQSTFDTVGEEKASEVEELCLFDVLLDCRSVEVARRELLCSSESSAERPLKIKNQNLDQGEGFKPP